MKKLLILLTGIALILVSFQIPQVSSYSNKLLNYYPCESPFTYSIGRVDSNFGITRKEFENVAYESGYAWNISYGKNLIKYDSNSKFVIELVFDERQSVKNRLDNIKTEVEKDKGSLDPSIEEFERLKSDFETRVAKLNEKINYWNNQGGAPKNEYDQIISEQQQLRQTADNLNSMAKRLNRSTAEYNTKVDALRKTTENYNTTIDEKPEGGVYDPNSKKIVIYYGSDRDELKRIMLHELGHALGLGHSGSVSDIMFPKITAGQVITQDDINNLKTVCSPKSRMEIAKERILYFYSSLLSPAKSK